MHRDASDLAVLAASRTVWFSAFVANLTSRLALFCVIFELISCVTPDFVAYVDDTVLVMPSAVAVMSDLVASPDPSAPR